MVRVAPKLTADKVVNDSSQSRLSIVVVVEGCFWKVVVATRIIKTF